MQEIINHLQDQINRFGEINARLKTQEGFEQQIRINEHYIETYQNEIFDIELLRDGLITKDKLGTARRFFNKVPEGFTWGT